MREKKLRLIVTFHTTAAAMAMEKHCLLAGLSGRLMPAPRQLTSDCGIAWCSDPGDRAVLEAIAAEQKLEVEHFHEILI